MPDLTAAPHPVRVGDKQYAMRPLRDVDYDELDNWWRATLIDMARKMLTPDMSQEERDEILGAAMREAHKISVLQRGAARDPRLDMTRVGRVLWQGLRRDQPKLALDEFMREMKATGSEWLPDMLSVFQSINMGGAPKNGAPKAPPEKAASESSSLESSDTSS